MHKEKREILFGKSKVDCWLVDSTPRQEVMSDSSQENSYQNKARGGRMERPLSPSSVLRLLH